VRKAPQFGLLRLCVLSLVCLPASSLPSIAATPLATAAIAENLRERVEAIDAGAELSVEGQRLQHRVQTRPLW